jgi:hypothetical protein
MQVVHTSCIQAAWVQIQSTQNVIVTSHSVVGPADKSQLRHSSTPIIGLEERKFPRWQASLFHEDRSQFTIGEINVAQQIREVSPKANPEKHCRSCSNDHQPASRPDETLWLIILKAEPPIRGPIELSSTSTPYAGSLKSGHGASSRVRL